jgi:excisionase family DNA binding protein
MQLRSTKDERHSETLAYNALELAERLKVSPRTIYDLVKRGKIPHARIGDRLIFPRAEIEKWLSRITIRPLDDIRLDTHNNDGERADSADATTETSHDRGQNGEAS